MQAGLVPLDVLCRLHDRCGPSDRSSAVRVQRPASSAPRDLGVGFVPHSPLGHGFLAGQIRSTADISDDDWRKTNPRFVGENFQRNLRIVDEG